MKTKRTNWKRLMTVMQTVGIPLAGATVRKHQGWSGFEEGRFIR